MQQTILERYGIRHSKVHIIPNYVDVQQFQPVGDSRDRHLLCYVGRLEKEKNIHALLDAIRGLDVELAVIGGGSLRDELVAKVQAHQLPVNFLGNIAHKELPAYFNRSSLFILPSFIEHHPKTLLEAMASGLPVIGTNVPGIRDLINHGETGFLCGTSSGEIRGAIKEVLSNGDLQTSMGENARSFIVERFALERIVKMELALLDELIQ
jgi:glycosyltransferase involved in cell wall biosynthesis